MQFFIPDVVQLPINILDQKNQKWFAGKIKEKIVKFMLDQFFYRDYCF